MKVKLEQGSEGPISVDSGAVDRGLSKTRRRGKYSVKERKRRSQGPGGAAVTAKCLIL